jgi:hypothetical protein
MNIRSFNPIKAREVTLVENRPFAFLFPFRSRFVLIDLVCNIFGFDAITLFIVLALEAEEPDEPDVLCCCCSVLIFI